MNITQKRRYFLKIFKLADKKYKKNTKRLAGEGWEKDYQMLIATIMSAQSRDETTIPIAENLFKKYKSLNEIANAKYSEVLDILKGLNYNKTKSKNIISCSQMILNEYDSRVPDSIEELIKLPGVGRKTANLVISEIYGKEGICVDTHVHRISNVLGIVKTKNPNETEIELLKIAPKKYWSRINRLFVLWGKDSPGNTKNKILDKLIS